MTRQPTSMRSTLVTLCLGAVVVATGTPTSSARAERYALERNTPDHAPTTADFRVDLRHDVELRYDGATQLSLIRDGRRLAQLELSIAPGDEGTPPLNLVSSQEGALESELYHWRYYNVDGVAFWNAKADVPGDPVLLSVDGQAWQWQTRTIRPHVSVGKAPSQKLRIATREFRSGSGDPIYIGLLRLDGREPTLRGNEVRWLGAHDWPLAILVADTHDELWFLAGQAQWTFDQAQASPTESWTAPPLCARCRNPLVGRADLSLSVQEQKLLVALRLSATPEVDMVAAEGLRLDGHRMGDALLVEGTAGATYQLSLEDPLADELIRSALDDQIDVEVEMATGLPVHPERVDATVDYAAREFVGQVADRDATADTDEVGKLDAARKSGNSLLPDHLSPTLLQSWPNPFRDRTTIEVTIPETMGEAFELDDELRKRVDPKGPAPFGANPIVRVRVYNVGGQLIRLLSEEARTTGTYSIAWDGKDLSGRPVAAGAYYVNVEIGDYNVTQRVLRLRG